MSNMETTKSTKGIWIAFSIYFVLYLASEVLVVGQGFSWLLLKAYSIAVSCFLIVHNKILPDKNLILPIIFTALYAISNVFDFNLYYVIVTINVFLSACAVISTFYNVTGKEFDWVRKVKKNDWVISLILGLVVGLVWGGINYLLMKGNNDVVLSNPAKAMLFSLNPAINEEITCRTVFYALCVYCMKGIPTTRKEKFTCYFMMMIPHILPHIMFDMSNGLVPELISFMVNLVLYVVIFGSVFAILQKKRDVFSAMVAHGTVDAIRFIVFGY